MPSFPRPTPDFNYTLSDEKSNLDNWFASRNVPLPNQDGKLLMATWNIANLGEQKRIDSDLELIAHLLSRFDLIAVQEIKENFSNFSKIISYMNGYDFIISDSGGNNERLGFIYRTGKVQLGKLFAEVAIPLNRHPKLTVHVPWTYYREKRVEVFYDLKFIPFDRNPFVGSFSCGNLDFMVANVHLYYGAPKNSKTTENRAKYARRVLEIYTLAQWAKKRNTYPTSYDNDIILLGDMNIPEMEKSDPAFKTLLKSGLIPSNFYSNAGGSNLNGDKTYDQLAVSKGALKTRIISSDVFDFDNGVFKDLWNLAQTKPKPDSFFNSYTKAYLSDHRPLWIQFDVS